MDKFRNLGSDHCKALKNFEEEVKARREELERCIKRECEDQIAELKKVCNDLEEKFAADKVKRDKEVRAMQKEHSILDEKIAGMGTVLVKQTQELREQHQEQIDGLKAMLGRSNEEVENIGAAYENLGQAIAKERNSESEESIELKSRIEAALIELEEVKKDEKEKINLINLEVEEHKLRLAKEEENGMLKLQRKARDLKTKEEDLKKLQSAMTQSMYEMKAHLGNVREKLLQESNNPVKVKQKLTGEIQNLKSGLTQIFAEIPPDNYTHPIESQLKEAKIRRERELKNERNLHATRLKDVEEKLQISRQKHSHVQQRMKRDVEMLDEEIKSVEKRYANLLQEFKDAIDEEIANIPNSHDEEKSRLQARLDELLDCRSKLRSGHHEKVSEMKEELSSRRMEYEQEKMELLRGSDCRYRKIGELQALIDEERCKPKVFLKQMSCTAQAIDRLNSEYLKKKLQLSEKIRHSQVVLSQISSEIKRERIDLENREQSIKQYISDAHVAEDKSNNNLSSYIKELENQIINVEQQEAILQSDIRARTVTYDTNQEHRKSCREKAEALLLREKMNLADQAEVYTVFSNCFFTVTNQLDEAEGQRSTTAENSAAFIKLRERIDALKGQLRDLEKAESSTDEKFQEEIGKCVESLERKIGCCKTKVDECEREQRKQLLDEAMKQNITDDEQVMGFLNLLVLSQKVEDLKERIKRKSYRHGEVAAKEYTSAENEDLKNKLLAIFNKRREFTETMTDQTNMLRSSCRFPKFSMNSQSATRAMSKQKDLQKTIAAILGNFRDENERNAAVSVRERFSRADVPTGMLLLKVDEERSIQEDEYDDLMYAREAQLAEEGLKEIKTDVSNVAGMISELNKRSEQNMEWLKSCLSQGH